MVQLFQIERAFLQYCQTRGSRGWRRGESGLHKDLLHALLSLVKQLVNFLHVLQAHPVRDHVQGVDFAFLDELQQMLPVLVHWRLAVTN